MKIISRTFILSIVALIFPLVLFGQARPITGEEYRVALKAAKSKTEKQIRKLIQIQKLYSNNLVVTTSSVTTEYLPPDKSRWVYYEDKGNAFEQIEEISIGNVTYRKENNGKWVKRKADGDSGISGTDDSTREYFVEETLFGAEKFQVLIEKKINRSQTSFDEKKIWINKEGLIFKQTATTSSREPQNTVLSIDTTYNYDIKPPIIEAPVK